MLYMPPCLLPVLTLYGRKTISPVCSSSPSGSIPLIHCSLCLLCRHSLFCCLLPGKASGLLRPSSATSILEGKRRLLLPSHATSFCGTLLYKWKRCIPPGGKERRYSRCYHAGKGGGKRKACTFSVCCSLLQLRLLEAGRRQASLPVPGLAWCCMQQNLQSFYPLGLLQLAYTMLPGGSPIGCSFPHLYICDM